MNTKKWTTREGKKIRIKDMTDSHLENTINFLERSKIEMDLDAASFTYLIDPDTMAFDSAEQQWENMCDEEVGDRWPIYNDLVAEFKRRKEKPSGKAKKL